MVSRVYQPKSFLAIFGAPTPFVSNIGFFIVVTLEGDITHDIVRKETFSDQQIQTDPQLISHTKGSFMLFFVC